MTINSGLSFTFSVWVLYISILHCFYGTHPGEAVAETITDPQEVEALKAIKDKMRNRKWDFSEDPCSGKGSWNVSQDYETQNKLVCEMHTTEGRTFFHVTRIYLKSQNLTGVVPAELANLTYLEEIDFSCNHLNGPIPFELGSLAYLQYLSLGMNNLFGRIPKELGDLINLKKVDLYSNELYGRLPRSLINLTHLEMLSIQSNRLYGKIPKIYGRFNVLETLQLEATSLQGPIPTTFSNLIQLQDLVLRSALIYGEIPKYIGDSIKPKILDLRFNNLNGSIPVALQNTPDKHKKIEYLYVGNNNLTGKLEEWLSTINNVDLSYNYFSGELKASWIANKEREQLNFIQNSFNRSLSNGRDQAYLQRGFTCRDTQ